MTKINDQKLHIICAILSENYEIQDYGSMTFKRIDKDNPEENMETVRIEF